MKDSEKKVKSTEEAKHEEKDTELTDEQMVQVTGGGLRDPKGATF